MSLISLASFESATDLTVAPAKWAELEPIASALVVDIVGDATITDAWEVAGAAPGGVRGALVKMLRREVLNPSGNQQEAQTGYSYTLPGHETSGIFATPPEVSVIRRAAKTRGIGSLAMTSDLDVWLKVGLG